MEKVGRPPPVPPHTLEKIKKNRTHSNERAQRKKMWRGLAREGGIRGAHTKVHQFVSPMHKNINTGFIYMCANFFQLAVTVSSLLRI